MTETKNQTLTGQVSLDGKTFRDCEFVDAQLMFEGGAAPVFINCRFQRSRFGFDGAAANTVNFLRAMAAPQSNMRSFVTGLIPELSRN
ncbi:hypothetical protein BH10PSE2_BH10PSE2_08690 [soil metagenome]